MNEAEEDKESQIIEMSSEQQDKKNNINKHLKMLKFSSKKLKFFVQDMLDFELIKAEKII